MNGKNYSKKVPLNCPTCDNTQFEFEETNESNIESIHCPSCNRNFSKDELIGENQRVIDNNIEEIKSEVVKNLKKMFKNIK